MDLSQDELMIYRTLNKKILATHLLKIGKLFILIFANQHDTLTYNTLLS